MADSSFYEDLKSGLGSLLDAGVDIYKTTLNAKQQQAATEAAAQAELKKADDIITIGNMEISVTQLLLTIIGTVGVVLLLKTTKG